MFITYLISVLGSLLIFIPVLNGPFTVPKTILFITGMDFLLIFECLKFLFVQKKKSEVNNEFYFNRLSLSIFIFTGLIIISTLFAYDFSASFFGNFFRLNGLWLHFHFLILVFFTIKLFKEEKKRDSLVFYLLITTVLISFYGLLQRFIPDLYNYWETSQLSTRIFSTLGQPNFLGYFLILVLPLFYYAYKKYVDYKYFVLFGFLISFLALVFTLSRGAWIGFIGAMLGFLVIKNWHQYKKTLVVISSLLIIITCFISIFGGRLSQDISNPAIRRIIKLVDVNSPTFQSRIVMWKGSMNLISSYPILGIGMDNIQNVFPRFISTDVLKFESSEKIPDRVHNLFLDLTINFGLSGLVALIFFIYQIIKSLLVIVKNSKDSNKLFFEMIGFGLFSYFLALQVGFQTIGDQIIFWVFLGLIIIEISLIKQSQEEQKLSKYLDRLFNWLNHQGVFMVAFKTCSILVLVLFMFNWSLKPLYADYLLKQGLDNRDSKILSKSIELTQYQGMHILYTLEVLRKNIQGDRAVNGEKIAKFTEETASLLKSCYQDFGQTYLCYLAEARYNDTLGVFTGNPNFYYEAVKKYQKSLELNPLYATAIYEQALIYMKLNQCQKTLELLKKFKLLELTPKPETDKYAQICEDILT